jgi:nuclear-control-of-ATPase protein 2
MGAQNPVKSAIMGSLIRVLMIQIQKVKVDVDLAMSGIEKLLRSQQLTFAFIGVAPSLLLVVGVFRWGQSLYARFRGSGGRRQAKNDRRGLWVALRELDLICSKEDNEVTLGLLLIQTQVLREYVTLGSFPRTDFLRDAFLEDVRGLEAAHGQESRRSAVNRIYRSWSLVLNFDGIV